MEIKMYDKPFLPEDEFLSLMESISSLFTPPISLGAELQAYSRKLYGRAHFLACREGNKTIAFAAFYKNKTARQLYVSLICVDKKNQRQGLGRRMLEMLASLKSEGFASIGLEVVKTNTKAYIFYKKQGFKEQEDRGEKFLMVKAI